jgi:hypothetical protein
MQLTPEQIQGLPPDQQAQVIALQEHMVRWRSLSLLWRRSVPAITSAA